VANAAKHTRASVVHVALHAHDAMMRVAIRDDGSGLTGLSDRIEALGGTLAVTSPADHGTTLLIEIPAAAEGGHGQRG
jgi:signal transduction histidine kinase